MQSMQWFVWGMIFGWLATLSAFALGAFVVFKTKREPYESMFALKEPKGEAFNLEDEFADKTEPGEEPKLPSIVGRFNSRFKMQANEGMTNIKEGDSNA